MNLTAELRVALESLRGDLRSLYWTTRYFGYAVEQATVERKQVDRWLAALQALLDGSDEKGGGGTGDRSGDGATLPVAGAASTAPPDSPAKIAAEMRSAVSSVESHPDYPLGIVAVEQWAARVEALGQREPHAALAPILVELKSWCRGKMTHHEWCGCQIARKLEALGLEPGEREVVRQATLQAKTLSEWINSCFNNAELCADPECEPCDGVRKLTGIIAALAPIAERKEGT